MTGDYQAVLALDPDNEQALALKSRDAEILAALAKGDYQTVLSLDPNNSEAMALNKKDAEITSLLLAMNYQGVLEIEPQNAKAIAMKNMAKSIRSFVSLGDYQSAFEKDPDLTRSLISDDLTKIRIFETRSASVGSANGENLLEKLITVQHDTMLYSTPDLDLSNSVKSFPFLSDFYVLEDSTNTSSVYHVEHVVDKTKGWISRHAGVVLTDHKLVIVPSAPEFSLESSSGDIVSFVPDERGDNILGLDNKIGVGIVENRMSKNLSGAVVQHTYDVMFTGPKNPLGADDEIPALEIVFVYEATDAFLWEIDGVKFKDVLQKIMTNAGRLC